MDTPGPPDTPRAATSPKDLVTAIHATPQLMAMNFAGAGIEALAWLHAVGGSSRTVLEAVDRYTPASLVEATGFVPERFTSRRVAQALAEHAYARAEHLALADGREEPLFGLGCTATIATDRPKRGEHRCVVAVRDGLGVAAYELVLSKGARDRGGEEELVSRIILQAIADASGVLFPVPLGLRGDEVLERDFTPSGDMARFAAGDLPWVLLEADGTVRSGEPPRGVGLFSGSFHPLHEGHLALADAAARHLGREVLFELPLVNADKSGIDPAEARRRAGQFAGRRPLLLSRAPLFLEKAQLFPEAVFVIGADTAARVVAPRFYGNDAARLERALQDLREADVRFLVAPRHHRGRFLSLAEIGIPEGYRDLFEALPDFRKDISSSAIRSGWRSPG